jgi:hypothetical protein
MKSTPARMDRLFSVKACKFSRSTSLLCAAVIATGLNLVVSSTSFAQSSASVGTAAVPAAAPAAAPAAPAAPPPAASAQVQDAKVNAKDMGMGMKKGHGPHGGGAMMGPACKADLEKLCAGVQPGEGRLIKCLKEKESQVSAECKASWDKMKDERKDRRQEMRAACSSDVEKHCPGMKPGDGKLMKCMKEKEAQLSEGCKSAMSSMGPNRR